MPVSWEIRGSALVVITAGKYTMEELERSFAEAAADPLFQPGMALLFDGTASSVDLVSDDIKRRAAWIGSLKDRGFSLARLAVVVGPESYRYGMARMLQIHLDAAGIQLEIFRDRDVALKWLIPTPS